MCHYTDKLKTHWSESLDSDFFLCVGQLHSTYVSLQHNAFSGLEREAMVEAVKFCRCSCIKLGFWRWLVYHLLVKVVDGEYTYLCTGLRKSSRLSRVFIFARYFRGSKATQDTPRSQWDAIKTTKISSRSDKICQIVKKWQDLSNRHEYSWNFQKNSWSFPIYQELSGSVRKCQEVVQEVSKKILGSVKTLSLS